MLVKLTIRRPKLLNRDEEAEALIQNELNDASLVVSSRLFRDKTSPINQIVSQIGGVYTHHRKHTIESSEKGWRILPRALNDEYNNEINRQVFEIERLLNVHMPRYDEYVANDINYRSRGGQQRASVGDYPTAEEFRARTQVETQISPMPARSHFLFDLSAEEEAKFAARERDIEASVRQDILSRMLDPLKHLSQKLHIPIGERTEDGMSGIFRDSAIENIVSGIEIAQKLNIFDSPQINDAIRELTETMAYYGDRAHWLRESPPFAKKPPQSSTT